MMAACGRGVAGAVLLFASLAALNAVSVPQFLPADEPSHYGYALSVARGNLPTIDAPIPDSSSQALAARLASETDMDKRDVWTANHPPLHPALVAAPIGWGEHAGRPAVGLVGARLLGSLTGAAAVVASAWLAASLVPGRPRVVLTAAGMVATVPLLVHLSGVVYNDTLALLGTTTAIAAGTAAVRGGPRWHLVAVVAVAASAAALTRASGLAAVAAAVGALGLAGLLAASGGAWQRLRGAVVAAAPATLGVVLAAGWFYARNVTSYGDATGAAAILSKFERSPRDDGIGLLFDPGFVRGQFEGLFNGFAGATPALGTRWLWLAYVLAAGLAAGAVAALARRVRRGLPDRRDLLAWLPSVVFVAVLALSIGTFVGSGGGPHPRYWFAALPVLATAGALGLDALPGRRWALAPVAFLTLAFGVGVLAWHGFITQVHSRAGATAQWIIDPDTLLLRNGGLPTVALVILGAGGLVLLCVEIMRQE